MTEPTVPIKYHLRLGDPRQFYNDDATLSFTYNEQAPVSLCGEQPRNEDPKQAEFKVAMSKFMHSLGIHSQKLLLEHPCKCCVCPKPAMSTICISIPALSPPSGHERSIFDFQAPVCVTNGKCEEEARPILRKAVKSILPSATDTTAETTLPIKYTVKCGDHRDNSKVFNLKFDAQAPASLCIQRPKDDAKFDESLTKFLRSLGSAHVSRILGSRPWVCIICKKMATTVGTISVPLLNPSSGKDLMVLDMAAPVCMHGGICAREAHQILADKVKPVLGDKADYQIQVPNCNGCGKTGEMKLCSGCNSIKYGLSVGDSV